MDYNNGLWFSKRVNILIEYCLLKLFALFEDALVGTRVSAGFTRFARSTCGYANLAVFDDLLLAILRDSIL